MADLYGVVVNVIKILGPLVATEACMLYSLKDDIDAITTELRSISAFLKSAEELAEGDCAKKEWVKQVRNLAHGIEDAIERFALFQNDDTSGKARYIFSSVNDKMSCTIKCIRDTAADIARRRELYFNSNDSDHLAVRRKHITTSYFLSTSKEEHELVGAEIYKAEIIDFLGLQKLDNTTRSTIAVVGMRGVGKTTVVSSVFKDVNVRPYFAVHAWISFSEPKKLIIDILRAMMWQFYDTMKGQIISEIQSLDKHSLRRRLQNYLEDQRYMVVFDDVQEDDIELATYIRRLLPVNNKGSKILMTTRYENVAFTWLDDGPDPHGMYRFKPLPSEKAWELFCQKAFKSQGESCPSSLEEKARDIVQKCGGLPPAIVSVARLLSSKSNDTKLWDKVHHSLGVYLAENIHLKDIHQTLMQNYYDLPYYLKPCFLYFGMFQKGYTIERMRLIRLWIAEGIVGETKGNLTLEEVGEEYLSELINMSLVEAKSIDPTGKVKIVGLVSEILHEVISFKLDELNFCKIISVKDHIGNESSRRLSIHNDGDHNDGALKFLNDITRTNSSMRSLFLNEVAPKIMDNVFSKAFLKNIRLLKVLDLFKAPIDMIPNEIGILLNLKYLSLRCTRISLLPSSIGELRNLQTLDLKQTVISALPKEISQLCRLRHLLGYRYELDFEFSAHSLKINGVKIPEGALRECLELQKLAYFDLGVGHKTWAADLMNLVQLRKLGIIGLKLDEGKHLCKVIDGMKYLQSLSVFSKDTSEDIDLEDVKYPPPMLERIYLSGPLLSFPTWIYKLQNLVKIRLRWSNLGVDPFKNLQLLPNLAELHLLEAYVGEDLRVGNEGFQKLKILHLLDLHDLRSLNISKGSLPLLEEMSIGKSGHLRVPTGIKHLSTLKTLNFYDMPSQFVTLLQPGEECYPIVKHVHDVSYGVL